MDIPGKNSVIKRMTIRMLKKGYGAGCRARSSRDIILIKTPGTRM